MLVCALESCMFFFSVELSDFKKIVGTFIDVVDDVAQEVEKEKMKVCSGSVIFNNYIII